MDFLGYVMKITLSVVFWGVCMILLIGQLIGLLIGHYSTDPLIKSSVCYGRKPSWAVGAVGERHFFEVVKKFWSTPIPKCTKETTTDQLCWVQQNECIYYTHGQNNVSHSRVHVE